MSERTGRKRLYRNSGRGERPGLSELVENKGGIVAAAISMKEAARRFENLVRCGPAQGGEVCRNHATLSSVTSLKRLFGPLGSGRLSGKGPSTG